MSQISDLIRKKFFEGDEIRDEGLNTPENIIRYDNIVYGTDKKWQVLDVYRPRGAEGKILPVIVSVHGGGWVYGDKERYQYYCMNLAERGFAVVNFTYRLAPEYKYPAPIEDTNLVFHWVLNHAEQYGFDLHHVFSVGDSAGAQNLALYTAICTNMEYAKEYKFQPPVGFVPSAIALNCGVYNINFTGDREDLTQLLMEDYLPQKGSKSELKQISVLNQITSNFPPTFIMTSKEDFLKKHASIIADKLVDCNVPFVYQFYSDSETELAHVFHLNIKLEYAKICNDEECDFFRRYCKE